MNENDYDTVESSKSLVNSMHMNSDIFSFGLLEFYKIT